MSEGSATNLDIAIERVVGFAQKFDRAHLDLACHAAFPQTLTPDLLYQIWLRFVPQAPWTAVARILLSRLCREVGYELYEMDVTVRNLLLTELKEDERFGKQRLDKLAEFYTDYLKWQFGGEQRQEKDLTQPQYWIALAHSQPDKVNHELAQALESKFKQENWKELFRIASSIEAIPEALVEFEPPLLNYARGMLNFTTGDLESAAEEFRKLPIHENKIKIADVNLPIPDEIRLPRELETSEEEKENPTRDDTREKKMGGIGGVVTWFRNQVNQYGYIEFLTKVLKATRKSNAEQVVYQLLAKNTQYLNENFIEVLQRWAKMSLGLSDRMQIDEEKHIIATDIANFSICILNFPLGDKASNVEIAIAGYEIVLTVFTRDTIPYHWALTQNGLGNAYSNRVKGDISENLELAIAAYESALEVFTRDSFPDDWAMVQTNLGTAYCQRIGGDKAENLELGIAAYNAALQVYTQNDFPDKWASVQTNLANAYSDRIRGEKAENIELAIAACKAALEVRNRDNLPEAWAQTLYTLGVVYCNRIRGDKAENVELAIAAYNAVLEVINPQAFPQYWAMTQNNLATAYLYRIRGDRTENIELAIKTFKAALQVYTRDALPQSWAETQTNLGIAYSERIRGDKAENIEQAIAALTNALKVLTQDKLPEYWAQAQNNLGKAYFERIRGNPAENLKKAIAAYKEILPYCICHDFLYVWARTQANLAAVYCKISDDKAENIELAIAANNHALEVYTHDGFPIEWAGVQNNLGNAYYQRIYGEKAENIELAIAAFKEALKVRTPHTLPQDWAMTQNNLGNAYSERIRGDKSENIEQGIAAFTAALEVYTRDAFPQSYANTAFNLGFLYQQAEHFSHAYTTYKSAIETVEFLREEIISGDETKRKQAEQWHQFYRSMVTVCLELDRIDEAIEYVERSKNRTLVELILESDRQSIFPPEIATQLERLQDEIATDQYQLQNGTVKNPTALAQQLQKLRQQRNDLQNRYLAVGDGFNLRNFQATLNEHTAVVEWYITDTGFETFIITCDRLQHLKTSQGGDPNTFIDWVNEYLKAYNQTKIDPKNNDWKNNLASRLSRLALILHLKDILNLVPKTCSRLVLIPHTVLHLFPLHALPLANSDFLCNIFTDGVSYAPSCQLLQQIQLRQRPFFESIFAIQNPTQDLSYTNLEVKSILNFFSSLQVLRKNQATKAVLLQQMSQLREANSLHFSCHGLFNLNSPIDSCLLLAESVDEHNHLDLSKCLTLGNLFARDFELNQCRLVVLSACETGLVDFTNISDEYISLPSGFLYAGSASVVSSLWKVDDLSTAFLMFKFYQNLSAKLSVKVALQQAQNWLRNVTKKQLEQWVTEENLLDPTTKIDLKRRLRALADDAQPFENPFYWAAFCAIGQ